MLTDELRTKLTEKMKTNPTKAVEEFKKDPKLLAILLSNDAELKTTKAELITERVKYVNMTNQMQNQLKTEADKLKTTQGLLIGAGIALFLALLSRK